MNLLFVILRNGPSDFFFDLLIYKWGAKLLSIFLKYHLLPILSLLETTFKFIWACWIIRYQSTFCRYSMLIFWYKIISSKFASDNTSDTIYLYVLVVVSVISILPTIRISSTIYPKYTVSKWANNKCCCTNDKNDICYFI